MSDHQTRSPGWIGYYVAVAATLAAALLRLALTFVLGEQGPFFPFVLAVLVTAWYGGLRPGLLATALGLAAGLYLSGPAPVAFRPPGSVVPFLFIVIGLTASLLCGALHAAWRRTEQEQRELARAEAEIRKNQELFRLVHIVAKIGHWEWNSVTDENKWSPEIEALYGLPPGQFAGNYEAWAKLVHPDDLAKAEQDVRRALETGKYFAEFRVVWPDGSVHWLEARALVFKDGHDKPRRIMGVNMDVTERKRAEEALRETDRRKDEFLAMLGHELRNPLAPLRNALSALQLQSSADPNVARLAPMMERQLATLVGLVDDLLDVSRISRGKIELRKQAVDLTALTARAAESARPALDEHRHRFELDAPSEPVWAEADAARVEQVLSNLLSNAARYTPPGGHVRLSLVRSGPEAVLRVRDTGIGIRAEDLPAVWETFRQAGRVEGRASEGLGLGLTLVRRLVELHGGTVGVASDGPDKGSEFTVRLPALPEGAEPPQRVETPETPSVAPEGLRVLVVDDNRDAADSLALVLQLAGHQTRTAGDGPQALAAAREFRPQSAFVDIGLPGGMDGYEVARRLRQEAGLEQMLLVAVTGYGTPEDVARAKEARFDHHVTKPADTDLVRRLLTERRAGSTAV
jgi:PAS domain S-box-containing protein